MKGAKRAENVAAGVQKVIGGRSNGRNRGRRCPGGLVHPFPEGLTLGVVPED